MEEPWTFCVRSTLTPGGLRMFDRMSRSWNIVRQSWNILLEDKKLMVFPVASGLASLATVRIVRGAGDRLHLRTRHAGERASSRCRRTWYALGFAFYMLMAFVTFYFNVAVMHCAALCASTATTPTLADGIRGANSHALTLLGWSAISATVGIRAATPSSSASASSAASCISLVGAAWAAVTYFVRAGARLRACRRGRRRAPLHRSSSRRRGARRSSRRPRVRGSCSAGSRCSASCRSSSAMYLVRERDHARLHQLGADGAVGHHRRPVLALVHVLAVSRGRRRRRSRASITSSLYRYAATGAISGGFSAGRALVAQFAPKVKQAASSVETRCSETFAHVGRRFLRFADAMISSTLRASRALGGNP